MKDRILYLLMGYISGGITMLLVAGKPPYQTFIISFILFSILLLVSYRITGPEVEE